MNSSDDSCTMEIATSKMCRTRTHKSTFQQQSNCTFITAILFLVISINSCHCSTAVPSGAQSAVLSVPGIQGGTGQIPLVRLPSNTLLKYTAYKDVSILHFRIPTDTRTAIFSFKAYEETKSAFQLVCQPKDVTLHLKAGSYPVISPENITFPRHFLNADQRFEIHNLQFKSDGTTKRLSIDGPNPGNWFAVAFISWTDPSNDRIEQQGLAASCETLLLAEMSVIRLTPITLNERILHTDTLTSNTSTPMSFKIFAPRNLAAITWQLNLINTCDDCPDISFKIQAHGLPSANTYLQSAIIYTNRTGEVSIEFHPHRNAWHYIDLEFIDGDNSSGGGSVEGMGDGETSDPIDSSSSSSTTSKPNTLRNNETDYQVEFSIQTTFHYDNTDDEFDEEDDDDISSSSSSPTSTNNNSGNNNENNNDVDVEMGQEKATDDKVSPLRSIKYSPLLRQTYREFFMFDYDLIPEGNGTAPVYLNITAGTPAGFRFDVGDVYDIGGTLSFAMAMKDNLKGAEVEHPLASGAIAEKLVDTSGGAEQSTNNLARSNQTIIICMRLGEPGIPTWPDKCVYGRHTFPAASIVNNTNEDTSTGLVHVPFPESGTWYVTLGLYCHGFETAARTTIIDSVKDFIHQHVDLMHEMKNPCACANQTTYFKKCINEKLCLDSMNETETLKVKECLMDSKCTKRYQEMSTKFEMHHKFATEQSVATDSSCNGSIVFTISSSPCVAGRCGRYGRCYHYMSGGFVFSTCLCIKGYRGWDCTEDTQVPSSFSILLASLLLTLSNLLFIPSIYFAVRRQYFTEAVIYFFAMFFSIFYHACDSGEDEYSFCLVKIGVLQFCDFYCGLLAIWVTLIAMANIRQALVSLLHMLGAIMLAFGTELNKQSLWVFLAPALTGICIISASWGLRCRKTRKWFPSRKYLAIFMPIGTVLVMVGLVCYAFLQTKQNYHIVHSIWHMVMALSILCLLPSRKSFLPKC